MASGLKATGSEELKGVHVIKSDDSYNVYSSDENIPPVVGQVFDLRRALGKAWRASSGNNIVVRAGAYLGYRIVSVFALATAILGVVTSLALTLITLPLCACKSLRGKVNGRFGMYTFSSGSLAVFALGDQLGPCTSREANY